MLIDLRVMPQGQTYEDRYQGFLRTFEDIAKTPPRERVLVNSPPWCWVPLLRHLDCDIETPQLFFDHCSAVMGALIKHADHGRMMDRTMVEVLCSFRPETADALWKCDMQWKTPRALPYRPVREFIVTTNGSYHRPEIIEYMDKLRAYKPTKSKCLLVPCAADKPYPAPLHSACLALMPDDFYLMNATGVVGLVPQDLWPAMPHYDSGIPNPWRLFETIQEYFSEHPHSDVVVYCDHYSMAIQEAFASIGQHHIARFVLPLKKYDDYEDLLSNEHLRTLKHLLGRGSRGHVRVGK